MLVSPSEYSLDIKDCRISIKAIVRSIFSQKVTEWGLTKDDILSESNDTDLIHYWTAAYRRILQIDPQTKCSEEREEHYEGC